MRPKKVILLVSSVELRLSLWRFLLETWGFRVLSAGSADDALELVAFSVPGSIDLLMADLLLRWMDGNELVRLAKKARPALPALLVSDRVSSPERAKAADAFLPKGFRPVELIEAIKLLTRRKRGPKKKVVVQEQTMERAA